MDDEIGVIRDAAKLCAKRCLKSFSSSRIAARVAFVAEPLAQSAFRQRFSLGEPIHHGPDADDSKAVLQQLGINACGADSISRHRDGRLREIALNVRERLQP
jgi:hypothetical protein